MPVGSKEPREKVRDTQERSNDALHSAKRTLQMMKEDDAASGHDTNGIHISDLQDAITHFETDRADRKNRQRVAGATRACPDNPTSADDKYQS